MSYHSLLLYPTLSYFLVRQDKVQKIFCLFIVGLCFLGIYQKQYNHAYRSRSRSEQNFKSTHFPALTGIQVDEPVLEKLMQFEQALFKKGFMGERVLVYPNAPGLISFLGLKAYGNPWNVNNYANSADANCAYILHEKQNEGERVFIYALGPLPLAMRKCIERKGVKTVSTLH